MSGEAWQDHLSLHQSEKDPCDKGSTSKWVLPSNSNGWQRLNGSHQWEVVETLLRLGKRVMWLPLFFCLAKSFYVSFTFFFPSNDYVTGKKNCNVFS